MTIHHETHEMTSAEASDLAELAKALLLKLENLTTEEFSHGGEREERRALHNLLYKLCVMEYDADGYGRPVRVPYLVKG